MSWASSNYKYRVAVAVDNTGSAGTTKDVTFTIPPDFAEFWTTVQSTGYDIRFMAADGITSLTWQRASWTYASNVGVIDLDNITTSASRMTLIWMYWGYSSATDGAGSFVPAAAISAYIDVHVPGGYIVACQPERKGATRPASQFQKRSGETTRIVWDFNAMLFRRRLLYQGALDLEEIKDVALCDVQLATVSQSTMIVVTKTRFIGKGLVETLVQAGTSGETYTAICRVTTTRGSNYEDRIIEDRALITIKDDSEV